MERVKKKNDARSDLTQGAILPKVIWFVIPLILTGVLSLLFNTADTIVVGRWGGDTPEECENALAAVGSCGALINLLINLFMGLSMGAGVCVAHDIGAKRFEDAKQTVHTAVTLSLICGILASLIGLFAARPLLVLMGTDASVLDQAAAYMRAIFIGIPATMVYHFCAAMYRSNGDTLRPLIFLSTGGVLNVLLNLFTVLVLRLGAVGVGIATASSNYIACFLIVGHMLKTDGICHLELRKLGIDRAKLSRILFIGIPAGISSSLFSVSNVLIQSSINSFGKVIVAGNTASGNLEGYVYTAQNAVSSAAMTFVSQNVGAKNFSRVKKSIWVCTLVNIAVGLGLGSLMTIFGTQLISLYAPDNTAVIVAGMRRLPYICLPYFICGLMEIGSSSLRGLGKSILPTVVSLLGSCVFRVIWIYTVFAYANGIGSPYALEILYISYPISWLITAAVHYVSAFIILKRKTAKNSIVPKVNGA